MSKSFYLIILSLFLSACSWQGEKVITQEQPFNYAPLPTVELMVGSVPLKVEIASSEAERSRGLAGRAGLAENEGMLFLFAQAGRYGFWMKGMRFPLDFIWLHNGRIVEITANVPPPLEENAEPIVIFPSAHIDAVIEVNAGWAKRHQIDIGLSIGGLPPLTSP